MKKITIIFAMFIIIMNATAQGIGANKDTTSLVKLRKNEIGVNIAPFFSTLLFASIPQVSRFSVSYKRILNDKSAFRIALGVDLSDEYNNTNYGSYNSQDTLIFMETGISLLKQHDSY